MEKENYKNKVYEHLKNPNSYQEIKNISILLDTETCIKSFLETIKIHQHINKNTFKFLIPPENPRKSLFYKLSKIHKPNIPGRPIVSSINSLTENISEFLTLCIQPLVHKLKSYIKDTTDFLIKNQEPPKNT